MSREIRVDHKLILRSQIAIGVSMLVIGGAVVWGFSGGDQSPAFGQVLTGVGVIVFANVAAILVPMIYYRCPTCSRKLTQVPEAKPAIHFYCPNCNIQWDSGWRQGRYY